VALGVEPSVWGDLEGQLNESGARLDTIRIVVGSSGARELRRLPDDLTGFARAWKAMRDRYAPSVRLGYVLDDYATGLDISQAPPSRSAAIAAGRQAAEFFRLAAGGLFDYTTIEVAFADAGKEPKDAYSPDERDAFVAFVREYASVAGTRVVLTGMPSGNTVMRTIDDKPYHWHDDWVQWLIGGNDFAGLRQLRDAGVIGIRFGGYLSSADSTCPCDAAKDGVTNAGTRGRVSRSADDDGGYLAERMGALRRTGGVPLT
jgi:nucleotide-binding universal stress UspA family protein